MSEGTTPELEQSGGWVEVDQIGEVLTGVVGLRIAKIERDRDVPSWSNAPANTITMTLEDGSQLRFTGIGYDSCACITEYRSSCRAE